MTRNLKILQWVTRGTGILLFLFVSMFALDAFEDGKPISQQVFAFIIHMLPALALLAVVIAGFWYEIFTAAVLLILAGLYAMTSLQHPDWILGISGPLLMVSILNFSCYLLKRKISRAEGSG
jgi:hypothetical protein